MASKLRKFLDIAGLYKLIQLIKTVSQEHWIGTQAEYNAQAANIPAGTIVALTDEEDTTYDHGKYSTNETVTGQRWINGKPIYRKVFPMDVSVSNGAIASWQTVASVAGMNIEKLVRGWGTSPQYGSCIYNDLIQVNSNNLQVWPEGYGIRLDNIIIEYTKTTD